VVRTRAGQLQAIPSLEGGVLQSPVWVSGSGLIPLEQTAPAYYCWLATTALPSRTSDKPALCPPTGRLARPSLCAIP
jgi:hypothetical protein